MGFWGFGCPNPKPPWRKRNYSNGHLLLHNSAFLLGFGENLGRNPTNFCNVDPEGSGTGPFDEGVEVGRARSSAVRRPCGS